jgi:hypothetical protein
MIKVKINNIQAFDKTATVVRSKEKSLSNTVAASSIMLKSLINQNLNIAIGDKISHFDVLITPNGLGIKVSVVSNDFVGDFLYSGTRAHDIDSNFQAMPMPDGGFARSVQHPGTEPLKPLIDRAVQDAVGALRLIL